MAGYTVQMYNGDWFISLINIMMWCVCLFGEAAQSCCKMTGLCLRLVLLVAQLDDVLCLR